MSPSMDAIRRRVDQLDNGREVKFYFVESDETDLHRLPNGPEVRSEIAAIEARDPRAHIIQMISVDGSCPREEAERRLAVLRAARAAEDEATA